MTDTLIELYPDHRDAVPLKGLYLAHRLHECGTPERPFVYANFVQSLDGRIALREPGTGHGVLPKTLTTAHDFRLLMELHAQADCLITHAGYLRAVAAGRLSDILQVGTIPGMEDLAAWREAEGLPPQPLVCVVSGSLDFVLPESVRRHGQRVLIATGDGADPAALRRFEDQGCRVLIAGEGRQVGGRRLALALAGEGIGVSFLLAGPRMLEAMLRDRMLGRLYVTIVHRLLGGREFHSLIEGAEMGDAGLLELSALYLDATGPGAAAQFFAQFRPAEPTLAGSAVSR